MERLLSESDIVSDYIMKLDSAVEHESIHRAFKYFYCIVHIITLRIDINDRCFHVTITGFLMSA